jgi:hypothetical protein
MSDIIKGYRTPPERELPWGERGLMRYVIMSYSIWSRNILIDLGVMKKKPKGKK